MKLSIIACVGKNLELGYKNDLIWKIKDDMKYFREKTLNHVVVMGKNTFLSLNGALKGRKNIVLTYPDDSFEFPSEVEVFHSIDEFISTYASYNDEVFVIGGASIYRQFLDKASTLYLTEVDSEGCADVYFPEFNKKDYTKEIVETKKEGELSYSFVIYRRK